MSTTNNTDLEARMTWLAGFLDKQAETLRAEASPNHDYLRGNDTGRAAGYELAAKFIRQELGIEVSA